MSAPMGKKKSPIMKMILENTEKSILEYELCAQAEAEMFTVCWRIS